MTPEEKSEIAYQIRMANLRMDRIVQTNITQQEYIKRLEKAVYGSKIDMSSVAGIAQISANYNEVRRFRR